jgi:hypothetical protein
MMLILRYPKEKEKKNHLISGRLDFRLAAPLSKLHCYGHPCGKFQFVSLLIFIYTRNEEILVFVYIRTVR